MYYISSELSNIFLEFFIEVIIFEDLEGPALILLHYQNGVVSEWFFEYIEINKQFW